MVRALFATAGRALMYQRRSHSSAALSVAKGRGRATESAPTREGETESVAASAPLNPSSMAWMPDPVTRCYRPANRRREMDAAEMRERYLSRK